MIGIHNPSSTDKKYGIQYLESGIHGVESKIQDCLGYVINYFGRTTKAISQTGLTQTQTLPLSFCLL